MHRTFLALTIAALAGFAPAAHAHDGATARATTASPHAAPSRGQVIVADLIGKGEEGTDCHADEANDQGGTNHIYTGKYKIIFGNLSCQSPTGEAINCRKDEHRDPPKSTCWDGHSQP